MTLTLSDDQVRFLRLRAQQLIPQSAHNNTSVARVVKELCGVQAQDARAATLAVRVRSVGLMADDVERARVRERSIIRTWGQRGTLHLLATEDLGWLLALLGPIFVAGDRSRRAELGLDEDICVKGISALRDILANEGALTRAELVEQLAIQTGIRLEGQAAPHLLFRAALEGIVCLGPDRGTKPTYVLIDDWIEGGARTLAFSRDKACAELAHRYLAAYGPAESDDLATWSGLPMSEVRTAWKSITSDLIDVEVAGRPAWMLKEHLPWLDEFPAPAPVVRLLPAFDTYLLGYRNRNLVVASSYAKRINAGGGMIQPTLIVDGQAIGTWKLKRQKSSVDVVVEPFEELAPEIQPGLEAEVLDIARFLGMPAGLQVVMP
ncbi:MAG TPA: winged helix DNA-binding domain-containing protein [Ktedonobacteraceae bacterium]|nr:winged helix DNA-binding domain-containing protein [Ktedonobacteraceae bacterium]